LDYATLKLVHVSCAVLSIGGFFLRGMLMLAGSPLLRARPVRVVPHVVDTLLLASAVALAWMGGQYPLERPWLTAKVAALVVYIALGMAALKGRARGARATAFVLALATAAYIVAVALTRDPLPGF
jgi:uncharacterized membrane protein SirB2